MYHSFPYSTYPPVIVPDENIQGIFEYPESNWTEDIRSETIRAIENPYGRSLDMLAKDIKTAVVIADLSVSLPVKEILPPILEKLESLKVPKIKILASIGGKYNLLPNQKKEIFGNDLFDRYEINSHSFRDFLSLSDLGYSSFGSRLYINSNVISADLVIGVSQIVPHRTGGFSGGSEIILPCCAGSENISDLTWKSAVLPFENIFGQLKNPIRDEMDQWAKVAKLSFIVNTVPNPKGKISHIVAGDYKEAFLNGAELSKELYGIKFYRKSDITIADSYPYDNSLFEASRGLMSASLMTKPGGIIIFVSPCFDGISKNHPFIEKYGYKSEDEVMNDFSEGVFSSLSTAAHILRMGRITRDKNICFMTENGIDKTFVHRLGFKSVKSVQEALEKAFFLKGKQASINILKKGGHTLPIYFNQ